MNVLIEATLRSIPVLALAWVATALLSRASADVRGWIWRTALTASVLFLIPVPVPEPVRISITSLADTATVSIGMAGSVPVLPAIWITGFALLLVRLVVRLAALVRLTRLASTFDGPNVRMSPSIMTPITWGVLRPVILLPTYVQDWPADKYAAMILHETAHIERQDWLWQTFAQCLTAVFWFHPLIWRLPRESAGKQNRPRTIASWRRGRSGWLRPAAFGNRAVCEPTSSERRRRDDSPACCSGVPRRSDPRFFTRSKWSWFPGADRARAHGISSAVLPGRLPRGTDL